MKGLDDLKQALERANAAQIAYSESGPGAKGVDARLKMETARAALHTEVKIFIAINL